MNCSFCGILHSISRQCSVVDTVDHLFKMNLEVQSPYVLIKLGIPSNIYYGIKPSSAKQIYLNRENASVSAYSFHNRHQGINSNFA